MKRYYAGVSRLHDQKEKFDDLYVWKDTALRKTLFLDEFSVSFHSFSPKHAFPNGSLPNCPTQLSVNAGCAMIKSLGEQDL